MVTRLKRSKFVGFWLKIYVVFGLTIFVVWDIMDRVRAVLNALRNYGEEL